MTINCQDPFQDLIRMLPWIHIAHAVVQGERVNKGAGYGLEVPCIYRVFGPPVYVCRMRELVNRGTSVMNVKLVLAFI